MRMDQWRRVALSVAVTATVGTGLGGSSAAASHAAASTAALGPCWLTNLGFGIGEDIAAIDFVGRWRAGAIQTVIQGTVPNARSWTLSIYHAQHGRMVSFYDKEVTRGGPGSSFTVTIGGARSKAKGTYVDPTAGGGDSAGYLFFRVYKYAGSKPTAPTITFKSGSALPSTLTSCSAMKSDLLAQLTKANKVKVTGNSSVGSTTKNNLWGHKSPFQVWSTAVDPSRAVPVNNTASVPLLTQVADPNIVYHAIFFNMTNGDMALHGSLTSSTISAQAPSKGMRYLSLCAYPKDQSAKPLACLDDKSLKVDSQGQYLVIVSPDQPDDTANWLNPGDISVGAIVLRWLLPANGYKAKFCLPSVAYRQPGDTTVPPLPSGC